MKFKFFLVAFLSLNIFANSTPAIGVVDPSDYIPKQKETTISSTGMVTTQHYIATKVGEKVLSDGGNAYDAAVAIGFALAVVLPRAGNIGGGGTSFPIQNFLASEIKLRVCDLFVLLILT